jgi:hypothetical protein
MKIGENNENEELNEIDEVDVIEDLIDHQEIYMNEIKFDKKENGNDVVIGQGIF